METTDTHTNLMNYDYYKGAASNKVGMVKTATLIKQARAEVENSILVDNGDTIQGTPLGSYMAQVNPLKDGEVHPAIKIMNELDYDMATLGNHEFNYGLDMLDEIYDDANFGYVSANVNKDDGDGNPANDQPMFDPYKIVEKKVIDKKGQEQTLKIGYIGFTPPQIMEWDKANLEGKVTTTDIVTTAEKYVPEMREKGADIVIALTHSGFNGTAVRDAMAEDAVYALSKVAGIDAITFSHTHKVFPAASEATLDVLFKGTNGKPLPGVNNAKGTINGVAAVQAGYGGGNLGIIDLDLVKTGNGKWKVIKSQSSTKAVKADATDVDQALVDLVKNEHEATVSYVNGKLGTTTAPIHSYFSLVQDDPSVQVVTNAQKWYVEKYIQTNAPEYTDTPILSVGAPFKAGRNNADEYTDIQKGDLTIRSAGDLYLYDNTLKAILVKGSVVKDWLEMTAGKFNQIDPSKTEEQPLLNPSFQVFNADVIDGVQYQVDVTKPAKYQPNGDLIDANNSRIINLTYNGKPVDPNQDFIVVTNNYRAGGGGNFPGVKGSQYIVDSADENRQILMDYIKAEGVINPTIDKNWSIAPVNGDVNVTFVSSPNAEAYANETDNIKYTGKTDAKGYGIYKIDLKDDGTTEPPKEQENVKVQLLTVNDLHGKINETGTVSGDTNNYGRMDFLATYLREREKENKDNTLLIHAGDMVGGSPPVSALLQDEPTVEIMNALGFDIGTVGNHEFDEGVAEMLRLMNGGDHEKGTKNYQGMNFPQVAANVKYKDSGELVLDPYKVLEVGGEKIGFIGVATTATPANVVSSAVENLEFTDEAEAIDKYTAELQNQGVHAIVVLSHVPGDQANDGTISNEIATIANNVNDDVDIILAAHNHKIVDGEVDGKLIVQAWEYGKAFGDIDIEIDPKTHDIVKKQAEVVKVIQAGVTPDAEIKAIIDKYETQIAPQLNEVMGNTATELRGGYITRDEIGDNPIGNLIADGMKAAMNSDFAMMNGGGIRASIDAGDITWGELFSVQPFNNTLVKLDITGAGLREVLNAQISSYGPDASIGGFSYTWDGKTNKVVDIFLPDGSKIDENATYTVTVNNYMAFHTTDKYKLIKNGSNVVNGPEDLQATIDFVKNFNGTINYADTLGRVKNLAAAPAATELVAQ